MGECKTMTGIERRRILEMHKQNLFQPVIVSEIGRSKRVIANFMKDSDTYGAKTDTERPRKMSLALGKRIR